MAVFANNPLNVQKKLRAIEEYCDKFNLKINPKKTEIVHFHLGRPPKNKFKYLCQGNEIKLVNKYTYLGIIFVSSGTFNINTKEFLSKANKNTGGIIGKSDVQSWDVSVKLYNSIVKPTHYTDQRPHGGWLEWKV